MGTTTVWGPANLEILKARWAKGDSARAIAGELGCSRNSVIAKANRLGLAPRRIVPNRKAPPQKEETGDDYDAKIPPWQIKTIMELTDQTCRWPLGNGQPYFFCGAIPKDDRPYCEAHCKRAYGYTPEPIVKAKYKF